MAKLGKPGKKSAKQVKLEKKIASLKKEHGAITKKKAALQKVLDREGKAREKQLTKLDKAIKRAQRTYDDLDNKDLPSGPKARKFSDQLYKIEDKIRITEGDLRRVPVAVSPVKDESDSEE